jgi:hypothetical protein
MEVAVGVLLIGPLGRIGEHIEARDCVCRGCPSSRTPCPSLRTRPESGRDVGVAGDLAFETKEVVVLAYDRAVVDNTWPVLASGSVPRPQDLAIVA